MQRDNRNYRALLSLLMNSCNLINLMSMPVIIAFLKGGNSKCIGLAPLYNPLIHH